MKEHQGDGREKGGTGSCEKRCCKPDTGVTVEIECRAVPRQLWLQFEDMAGYQATEAELMELLKSSEGNDQVIIYLKKERAKKMLPPNWNVMAT